MLRFMETSVLILIVLPSLLILFYPLCVWLAKRRFRHARREVDSWPDLSVIVPVRGLDDGARENLRSLFSQNYAGKVEIIFSLEDEQDPAVKVIREIIAEHSEAESRIVFSGSDKEYRGKIHNLVEALKISQSEAVMFVDSDVRMTSDDYLTRFVEPLGYDEVGLVTCYQAVYAAKSLGAGLIALMINADLMGYFSTLFALGRLNLANGAILALRREVVDRIGGLADLRNTILNDTAVARKVARLSKQIILADRVACVYSQHSTIVDWWHQVSRWHIAMRSYMRLPEYAVYGLSRLSLLMAAVYVVIAPLTVFSIIILTVPLLSRTVSLALINLFFLRDRSTWSYFGLIYLLDLGNVLFLLTPFFTRKIVWRGRSYRVGNHATLEPLETE
ncbi:MAG: glycosyltransferase [Candidatus Zixiibacteriota bacterium]|nr:MAG: glycosyltransferase [candidate division Zixibacteria bacterium]